LSLTSWSKRRLRRSRLAALMAVLTIVASVGIVAAAPSAFLELDGNVVASPNLDWAKSGALTAPTTLNGVWTRAGSNGVFDGGVFKGQTVPPLAPSAIANANIADSVFDVDALSIDITACPNPGDPTVFTGQGSETNNSAIAGMTYNTGSTPNKDDVSNTYAIAHVTSAGVNEVFFGGERVNTNGDSHMDFEFLQADVSIPAACGTGSTHMVGDRTQGDFLVSIDFTTGGTFGGLSLHQWQCDKVKVVAKDGTVCNPTNAKFPAYVDAPSTAATAVVNAATTPIGCGGWVCRLADGTPTTTLAQNALMEGGIDLAQLGFSGCVSTFWPHTRSSQSFTAVLKDLAPPQPFDTCKNPSITTSLSGAGQSGASITVPVGTTVTDQATLTDASADAGGTVTYTVYTNNTCTAGAIDAGTKTVVNAVVPASNGITFNTAGTYYWQAVYSGDQATGGRNAGATSACTAEVLTVSPNNPTISSTPAAQIRDSASVNGLTATATGNVTFRLYKAADNATCNPAGTVAATFGPFDVSGNVVAGTYSKTTDYVSVAAGTWNWVVSYSGDVNNLAKTSACGAEQVVVGITALP
jgi:hypothetical protein